MSDSGEQPPEHCRVKRRTNGVPAVAKRVADWIEVTLESIADRVQVRGELASSNCMSTHSADWHAAVGLSSSHLCAQ